MKALRSRSALLGHLVRICTPCWVLAIGIRAWTREDPGPAFVLDLSEFRAVPPHRIGWVEAEAVRTGLVGASAFAIGPEDQFAVAIEHEIVLGSLRSPPTSDRRMRAPAVVRALAFALDGTLWVASEQRLWYLPPNALTLEDGPQLSENSQATSIAVASNLIAVADAGMKLVWLFDDTGRLVRYIRAAEPHGFVIPSPHFDVTFESPTTLWIVNPGELRLEEWSADGRRLRMWGRPGFDLDGFSGCCNPTDIARLPDGRIVTAEKGLLRIKVYSSDGQLQNVVAAPASFSEGVRSLDIAVDSRGRVLVADPVRGAVRVFVPKSGGAR